MQTIGFQQAIDAIITKDKRYQPEAYDFLRDGLETALKQLKKRDAEAGGHVSAAELLEGVRLQALKDFGPMTVTVFEYWGIHATEDFGNMVFNLVEEGVFGKTEEDTIEAFRNGYSFEEAFVQPFQPERKNLSSEPDSAVERLK